MDDRLVVVGEREAGEEYLARWLGHFILGHDPRINPVTQILRMLRYPDQGALIWPEKQVERAPMASLAIVRMPLIREATLTDRAALDWFRDYGASVRWAALDAIRRAPTGEQALMIALQLAGRRPRRVRSVYVLSRLEVMDLALDTPGTLPGGGIPAPEPAEGAEGGGADPRGSPERRGQPDQPDRA